MRSYNEYLLSEHWKNLKSQAFILAGHKCEACFRQDVPRAGHHLVYRNPLESCTREDIMCLCVPCHDLLHQWLSDKGLKAAALNREQTKERCRILVRGFARIKPPKIQRKIEPSVWRIEEAASDLSLSEIEHLKELLATRKQSGSDASWNWAIKRLSRSLCRNLKHLRRSPKGARMKAKKEGKVVDVFIRPSLIQRLQGTKGGYTRAELDSLGVSWPPKKGWKKDVLARLGV